MEIISFNSSGSMVTKKMLFAVIKMKIEQEGWTQFEAAEKLGIDQPKVSQIKNDKMGGFSLERLLVFLKRLDHEITITIVGNKVLAHEAEKVKHEAES
jgi:predicted XRE-type DNA-binding protein